MDGDEKVEQRGNKKEEFLGIKLKNGILVGKKVGQKSTPSPTWRLGLGFPQTDDDVSSPFQDFTFPSNFTPTISARKLAANLWEVVEPNIESVKMNKTTTAAAAASSSLQQRRNHRNQPSSTANNLRKHVLDRPRAMQNQESIARAANAFLHPTSPGGGSSSSMEVMAHYRPPITTHSRVKGSSRFRDSGYDLNTSTELLKVLNRIWSLEEQQVSNMSLMKEMQKELDSARAQIKALLQEKKRNCQEMNYLMKQLDEANYDYRRKNSGQEEDRFHETIHSLRNELEGERKLRKHSESVHRKLARQLSEVKSSFSNALKELDRERKARVLLEDLCDEFAKGIRDYEQEIRVLKHKSDKDPSLGDHTDQLILHISEAWLDERVQMKLAEAGSGLQGKKTILDKLSFEIETFLQTKQSGYCGNNGVSTVKNSKETTLQRSSLESFHLNEAGSAPKNGKDEEDSIDTQLYSSKANRDINVSTNQQAETAAAAAIRDVHNPVIPNPTKKRILSRPVNKNSGLPKQTDYSCHGCKEPVLSNFTDASVQEKGLLAGTGKNSLEHLSSHVPGIKVDKWTSKEISGNPESSSLRFHEGGGTKENTLKAKLLEARLESRKSHSITKLPEYHESAELASKKNEW